MICSLRYRTDEIAA